MHSDLAQINAPPGAHVQGIGLEEEAYSGFRPRCLRAERELRPAARYLAAELSVHTRARLQAESTPDDALLRRQDYRRKTSFPISS